MNAKNFIRTDLAIERRRADTEIEGVSYTEKVHGEVTCGTLTVESEEGAKEIGRPIGHYVTLKSKPFSAQSEDELSCEASLLAAVLKELCQAHPSHVMVAGLGNRALTVDAIGPLAASRTVATAHLAELEPRLFSSLDCSRISVLSPGVLSETGIESAELIKNAVKVCKPDLVILIDALAARGLERLASTVQISDTGLCPGAGVGNHRKAIDKETLGVPVLVIGVPTVIDSATLLFDTLSAEGEGEPSSEMMQTLAKLQGLFVCVRECDAVTENASRLIAEGINRAFGIAHSM